jgi:hypothetical protein
MNRVAAEILKRAGYSGRRIVPAISGSVGIISGFMQNVGAAAGLMRASSPAQLFPAPADITITIMAPMRDRFESPTPPYSESPFPRPG